MLCKALSLVESRDEISRLPGLLRVGTWQSSPSDQRPVILAVASSAVHLVELVLEAMTGTRGSIVLLTPTRARWSSRSEAALDPDRVTLVPLDEVLDWSNEGWRSSDAWNQYVDSTTLSAPDEPDSSFRIETGTFTVWKDGTSCPLGNTVGFRVMRQLARRPGFYVSTQDLLDDAWDGAMRSKSAVQKTISGLRKQLEQHGLNGLTIDGSQQGHYALEISASGKR